MGTSAYTPASVAPCNGSDVRRSWLNQASRDNFVLTRRSIEHLAVGYFKLSMELIVAFGETGAPFRIPRPYR